MTLQNTKKVVLLVDVIKIVNILQVTASFVVPQEGGGTLAGRGRNVW